VTFVETGLPTGTDWYVGLASDWGWAFNQTNNSSLAFTLPNGTYGFSIGPVWTPGGFYIATPDFATVTVAGAAVTVDVTFALSS